MLMTDPRWEAVRHAGRINGRWLRTVDVATARAFHRGYDRDVTDGLLADCADTIDELTAALHDAYDEVAELRRQARTRAARRGRVRARSAGSAGRRRRPRVRRPVLG